MKNSSNNLTYLNTVRINDNSLTQYINLNDDSVIFKNDETNSVIFKIIYDGACKFKDTHIGNFRYNDKYNVRFIFDPEFLLKNPSVLFQEINSDTGDFITAECFVIKLLIMNYPTIFEI